MYYTAVTDAFFGSLRPKIFSLSPVKLFLVLSILSFNTFGISLYQIGNSLTTDSFPINGAFVETANSNGQIINRNGWHIQPSRQLNYIYNNSNDPNALIGSSGNWVTALASQSWDVVTIQPHYDGTSTLGTDAQNIIDWMNLASGVNPDTQIFIYAAWPQINASKSYSERWLENFGSDPDQPTELNRAYFRNLESRIENATGRDIGVIPIGEAWYQIEQQAKAGNIKNVSDASDLYSDVTHANNLGRSVIAWTMYASLFGESTVGVDLSDIYTSIDGVLEQQLQTTIDQVVLATPIPSAVWLFGSGFIGLMVTARKRS